MRLGHGQRRSVLILWAWTALLSGFVLYPTYNEGRGDALVPDRHRGPRPGALHRSCTPGCAPARRERAGATMTAERTVATPPDVDRRGRAVRRSSGPERARTEARDAGARIGRHAELASAPDGARRSLANCFTSHGTPRIRCARCRAPAVR